MNNTHENSDEQLLNAERDVANLSDFGREDFEPEVDLPSPSEVPSEAPSEAPAEQEQPEQSPQDLAHYENLSKAARENFLQLYGANYAPMQQPVQQAPAQQPPVTHSAPQAPVQPVQQPTQEYVSPITKERIPDPNVDFPGYMKFLSREVHGFHEFYKQQEQQAQQMQMHQAMDQQLQNYYKGCLGSFTANCPDFSDASAHFVEVRKNQLQAMSDIFPVFKDPNNVENYLIDEFKSMVAQCAMEGLNPAEQIYNVSKKLGYKGKAESSDEALPDNVTRLHKVVAHQAASKTLANTGGARNATYDTIEKINGMPDEDFSVWYGTPEAQEFMKKC